MRRGAPLLVSSRESRGQDRRSREEREQFQEGRKEGRKDEYREDRRQVTTEDEGRTSGAERGRRRGLSVYRLGRHSKEEQETVIWMGRVEQRGDKSEGRSQRSRLSGNTEYETQKRTVEDSQEEPKAIQNTKTPSAMEPVPQISISVNACLESGTRDYILCLCLHPNSILSQPTRTRSIASCILHPESNIGHAG